MKKVCKKCHHGCHCKEELHSDIYGLCPCDNCDCGGVVSKGVVIDDSEECLSCQ